MGLILWTRRFLQVQGYTVSDNVVYQDNQSVMLLENNGRMSSSKRTRHIDIRYFFVTDNVKNGNMQVEYCPTDDMLADFFTKPLQGSKYRCFRTMILNLPMGIHVARKECVEKTFLESLPYRSLGMTTVRANHQHHGLRWIGDVRRYLVSR
jgi:hypothetical protein